MKIYRLIGTLGSEYTFDVYEWIIEKETNKTYEIVSNDGFKTKKRLSKDKIGKIDTNIVNTVDNIISYNVYLNSLDELDNYKNEIKNKIIGKVVYFEEKLKEKLRALENTK
jgi:hypothetical protein